jgi:hypothetical protein
VLYLILKFFLRKHLWRYDNFFYCWWWWQILANYISKKFCQKIDQEWVICCLWRDDKFWPKKTQIDLELDMNYCNIYRITAFLKVETNIITNITASQIGRDVIQMILYVQTFKTNGQEWIQQRTIHLDTTTPVTRKIQQKLNLRYSNVIDNLEIYIE